MRGFVFEDKEIPLCEEAGLMDAIHWIAGKIPITEYGFKMLLERQTNSLAPLAIEQAKIDLCYHLRRGSLQAYGCYRQNELIASRQKTYETESRFGVFDGSLIPEQAWYYDKIDWENDGLTVESLIVNKHILSGLFYFIQIPTQALLAIWPRQDTQQKTEVITNKNKELCRAIAQTLWHLFPSMTAEEISAHHTIQEFGGGKNYTGKNTLKDWIREVDPRPAKTKRGRKAKA